MNMQRVREVNDFLKVPSERISFCCLNSFQWNFRYILFSFLIFAIFYETLAEFMFY